MSQESYDVVGIARKGEMYRLTDGNGRVWLDVEKVPLLPAQIVVHWGNIPHDQRRTGRRFPIREARVDRQAFVWGYEFDELGGGGGIQTPDGDGEEIDSGVWVDIQPPA